MVGCLFCHLIWGGLCNWSPVDRHQNFRKKRARALKIAEHIMYILKLNGRRSEARLPKPKAEGPLHKTAMYVCPALRSGTTNSIASLSFQCIFSFPFHIRFIILWLFIWLCTGNGCNALRLCLCVCLYLGTTQLKSKVQVGGTRWRCGFLGIFCRELILKVKWPRTKRKSNKKASTKCVQLLYLLI